MHNNHNFADIVITEHLWEGHQLVDGLNGWDICWWVKSSKGPKLTHACMLMRWPERALPRRLVFFKHIITHFAINAHATHSSHERHIPISNYVFVMTWAISFTHSSIGSRSTWHTHCKNTWVISTIFWSSQLHACCVRDMLQTSKDASNLIQSVVEKLLYFVRL